MTPPTGPNRPLGPHVRDLLELAADPGFDQLQQQIDTLAGCTRPIRLHGRTTHLDPATGELLPSHPTHTGPGALPERLLVACGNRRATRCPACSRVYAADTFHLIKSGLVGGKTVPDTVRAHPRVFATLTAPSFGPVHNQPGTGRCRCGTRHQDTDPVLGSPLDPDSYDYTGAVLFNAHAAALWARFTIALRREVARTLGLPPTRLPEAARVSFAKVAEYQKRAVVHFHAVIRLDGPDGPSTQPPDEATAGLLAEAIRTAAARVQLTVPGSSARVLRWGTQIDVQEITPTDEDGDDLTDAAVAAYIAKYATKSAETTGTPDQPVRPCPTCRGTGQDNDGSNTPCAGCQGTGLSESLDRIPDHARRMIRTCWRLARRPELAELRLARWAHMLGFKGHFSTKSRRYSTTLTALRDARRSWRADQARRRHPDSSEQSGTVLTLTHWAYAGGGYRPGEELLAATVRTNRALHRQLRREGEDRP